MYCFQSSENHILIFVMNPFEVFHFLFCFLVSLLPILLHFLFFLPRQVYIFLFNYLFVYNFFVRKLKNNDGFDRSDSRVTVGNSIKINCRLSPDRINPSVRFVTHWLL